MQKYFRKLEKAGGEQRKRMLGIASKCRNNTQMGSWAERMPDEAKGRDRSAGIASENTTTWVFFVSYLYLLFSREAAWRAAL